MTDGMSALRPISLAAPQGPARQAAWRADGELAEPDGRAVSPAPTVLTDGGIGG